MAPGQVGFRAGWHVRHADGIATVIHWDKFTHDHVAFWLWAGLYFTTPFLVFAVWAANRGHGAAASGEELELPAGRLDVVESVSEVHGRLVTVPPKTLAGRRTVRVPRFVADALADTWVAMPVRRVTSSPALKGGRSATTT